jgi:hypothetical protein
MIHEVYFTISGGPGSLSSNTVMYGPTARLTKNPGVCVISCLHYTFQWCYDKIPEETPLPFEPGHKYYPKREAPIPEDPMDKIESGLSKMMNSSDPDERLKAYKLYISLIGKHARKKTVLEPTIERLVSWLYSLADLNQQPIADVIRALTQSTLSTVIFGTSNQHTEVSPLISQELLAVEDKGYA